MQPREAGTVPRAKAAAAAKAVTSTYMSKKEQKSLKEVRHWFEHWEEPYRVWSTLHVREILIPNVHLQASHAMVPLDATTVDVYRGADAIIFMVDPTKPCVPPAPPYPYPPPAAPEPPDVAAREMRSERRAVRAGSRLTTDDCFPFPSRFYSSSVFDTVATTLHPLGSAV